MEISIPKNLALSGGKYNAKVHDLRIVGSVSESDNGTVIIETTVVRAALSLDDMFEMVVDGGAIKYVPTFMVLLSSMLDDPIPEGLPNRSYIDDNDNEVIRTWRTWRDDAHLIRYSLDGSLASFGLNGFGEDLTIAEVKIINDLADSDIQLLLPTAYNELMETSEWQESEEV